jgi:hypothetical protein
MLGQAHDREESEMSDDCALHVGVKRFSPAQMRYLLSIFDELITSGDSVQPHHLVQRLLEAMVKSPSVRSMPVTASVPGWMADRLRGVGLSAEQHQAMWRPAAEHAVKWLEATSKIYLTRILTTDVYQVTVASVSTDVVVTEGKYL